MTALSHLSRTILSFLILFISLTSAFPRDWWPRPHSANSAKSSQKNSTRQEPKATTVTTEKSADCNEFPDPGYGGSDPDTYTFWPEATRISVTCWMDNFINGFNYTYLRASSGCYVDEMSLQASRKDFPALLPKCPPIEPYQVYTTKNDYLLPKDGFWMSCYKQPKKKSEKYEVQWGARHVTCSVEGDTVESEDTWYRDAHKIKGKENEHCYVPADAFDNLVYEIPGAGMSCDEYDRKRKTLRG